MGGIEIIDPHVHVWVNDPAYPWAPDNANPPTEDAAVEQLLDRMQANGVSKTVLVQVIHYKWDNAYAGDCLKRYPETFEGVCRVDPESTAAADDLSRWVEDFGFRGVRLSPAVGEAGDWFASEDLDPVWARAQSHRVPVCILTHLERLSDLEDWIRRYEDVQVCVDHMAWPPVDKPESLPQLLSLAQYPEVYVKISGTWAVSRQPFPYADTHDTVRRIYDAFGPERLMWGTDWPLVEAKCGYTGALEMMTKHLEFLTDEDLQWVLSKTVRKLWPFNGRGRRETQRGRRKKETGMH